MMTRLATKYKRCTFELLNICFGMKCVRLPVVGVDADVNAYVDVDDGAIPV